MSALPPLSPLFAWLEITEFCNLRCRHCYASSSPKGTHGDMATADWLRVIDQLRQLGVRHTQFIGGEPTLHPDLPTLIRHALAAGLKVEVFSNLTHISENVWQALQLPGVRLAFSYYSDDPEDHEDVTDTVGSHARTRATIEEAKARGIPLRASVIKVLDGQRHDQAREELLQVGFYDVRVDRLRQFGRGADGRAPDIKNLCGQCGVRKFAISPWGDVWPCVFSRWMPVGNVHHNSLTDIYRGEQMRAAVASLAEVFPEKHSMGKDKKPDVVCTPDCQPSFNTCSPQLVCAPDAECGPTGQKKSVVLSPHRSVRYYDPGVSNTDC
ncbi:radical SAM/SPASM domain-containing protein [Streptosporangium nondiastaticum]|uniref:radical SAM/SPASM domain-containing protein n=1 Tax=Streptosporangium nondiastaticum TaxID=35764 RepID=UPI001CB9796F|nr:radical SAM protein [Streptosporangium nondiastaticum]